MNFAELTDDRPALHRDASGISFEMGLGARSVDTARATHKTIIREGACIIAMKRYVGRRYVSQVISK